MSELFPAYNPDDVVKLLPGTEWKDSLFSDVLGDVLSDVGERHFHKAGVESAPSSHCNPPSSVTLYLVILGMENRLSS